MLHICGILRAVLPVTNNKETLSQATHVVGSKSNFACRVVQRGSSDIKFCQNWWNGFEDVEVEVCPFPLVWPLAYIRQLATSVQRYKT